MRRYALAKPVALEAVAVDSSKAVHAMRQWIARLADMWKIPADQVSIFYPLSISLSYSPRTISLLTPLQILRAGGREHGACTTSYLARLPRHYMRVVAGFGSAKGTCFLRRSQEYPPPALATKLWPWVDAAVADYAAGGIPDPDLAGKEFLSLLQRLRYVFLQDAALLQPQFPRLCLWTHAVFQDPAWPPFAERVRAAEAVQEDPAHVAMSGVVPVVADAMSAVGNRLSVGQDRLLRATLTTPALTADLVRRAL